MAQKALLMFDVEHIKGYVFGTGKLKEIRGASALLAEFNEKDLVEIVSNAAGLSEDDAKIFSAGGVGLFQVPPDKKIIEEIMKKASSECRKKMINVSLQSDWLIVDEDDLDKNYNKHISELTYRLHEKKFREAGSTLNSLSGYTKVCESCGKYPGINLPKNKDYKNIEDEILCMSCHTKRQKNDEIQSFHISFGGDNNSNSGISGVLGKIIPSLMNNPQYNYRNEKPVEEFSELGKLCSKGDYMGLIYCDGNNMGNYIENNICSPKDMRKFSIEIEKCLTESLIEAVTAHLKPKKGVLPFDILLLGGDDLVMVTPADKIIDTAITIGKSFDQKMSVRGITLSIGLVIAKSSFPFNQYREIAESLLKSAKKDLAERCAANPEAAKEGTLNFKVITASGSLEFSKDDYTTELQDANCTLTATMRPYTFESMEKLSCLAKEFKKKNFPLTPLQYLRSVIDRQHSSKIRSTMETIDLISRIRDKKYRVLLHKLIDLFNEGNKSLPSHLPPWTTIVGNKNSKSVFATPIIDFTDLYNFMAKEG